MHRLNLVLLASLQLCSARQPGFSIHDDLLAHPQFEVVFSDSYISESDALALLASKRAASTYTPDASQTDLTSNVRESAAADATAAGTNHVTSTDGLPEVGETYEILSSPPSRYLCSVPTIARAPELNRTATELAKAEEARELTRASAKGWELMNGLNGLCLYYVAGWWSYKFCYGHDIVQFHAQPSGVNGGPPVKEPKTPEYVLGRTKDLAKSQGSQKQRGNVAQNRAGEESKGIAPPNTELQIKGDQRYLVQRLDGGTICDLTGRPRTIEIQYHCNPAASNDHISWIKEVTTCAYLMVVHTPRLCDDVAFLPPKETRAHPISCQVIVSNEDELAAWKWQRTADAKQSMGIGGAQKPKAGKDAAKQHPLAGMTIGGIVIGGKRVMGSDDESQEPVELKPPRGTISVKSGAAAVAFEKLAASAKKLGDGTGLLSIDELEAMGLDQETVELVRKELRRLGGDNDWEIAVEVVPDAKTGKTENGGKDAAAQGNPTKQPTGHDQKKTNPGNDAGGEGAGAGGGAKAEGEDEEGSQEVFYKDEL
ncbi:glucosidase II beta subunit-like protein-domain-containing protein [Cercophora newfieldiana]|uniref:Endoplasmic reticulum lectin n=1 Tax=Cercophora newfieldiana TaxID=92897 RepID=A0AA39XZ47_9PEZI|nr:glucosidase II beta subunit-like protein-domain-containing protein [Cercophora newfieldiana]